MSIKLPQGVRGEVEKTVRNQTQALVSAIKRRRRLTRRILMLLAAFGALHVSLILIVSVPASQEWLIGRAREAFERGYGIRVDIGYVHVGLFPPRVGLEDLQVALAPSSSLLETLPFFERASVAAAEMTLGLDIVGAFAEPSSALSSVSLSGLRLVAPDPQTIPQILKLLRGTPPAPSEDADWWPAFQKTLLAAPARVHVDDSRVALGQPQGLDFLSLSLPSFDLIKGRASDLTLLLALAESRLQLEGLRRPFVLESLRTELRLRADRNLLVDAIRLKSEEIELSTGGLVHLGKDMAQSSAELDVDTKFNADLLGYLDLESAGSIEVNGKLSLMRGSVQRRSTAVPSGSAQNQDSLVDRLGFVGEARWKELKLDDFAVYSGSTAVSMEAGSLAAARLAITTTEGGKITGSGSVQLSGTFPFAAQVDIKDLRFLELLRGLGVDTRAVDFKINSTAVRVSGDGAAQDPAKNFRLDFLGSVQASALVVPSIRETPDPVHPLPDCQIELTLRVDAVQLDFDGSRVACGRSEPNIEIRAGRIAFSDGATRFTLSATELNLGAVSYFAKIPVAGLADLRGEIRTERGAVVFETDIAARDFVFDGFGPAALRTHLRIDSDGLTMSRISAQAQDVRAAGLRLSSQRIYVSFGQRPSSFQLKLNGNLESLRYWSPQRALLADLRGEAKNLAAAWDMSLSHLDVPAIDLDAQIENFSFGALHARQVSGRLSCDNFLCASSVLHLNGASIETGDQPRGQSNGTLSLRFRNVSAPGFALDMSSSALPFASGSPDQGAAQRSSGSVGAPSQGQAGARNFTGQINARLQLAGPFAAGWPEVRGSISLDDIVYSGTQQGSLMLDVTTVTEGHRNHAGAGVVPNLASQATRKVDARLSGAFDQVKGRVSFDLDPAGKASGILEATNFDVMSLFGAQRARHNLYSELSGRLSFTSPSPLAPGAFVSEAWQRGCRADGVIDRFVWSAEGTRAEVTRPMILAWHDDRMSVSQVALRSVRSGDERAQEESPSSLVQGDFNYSPRAGSGSAKLSGQVHLGILQSLTTYVDDVQGVLTIDASARFEGGLPNLRGKVTVEADKLGIAGFDPDITLLKGRADLSGDKLEIISLSGNKGSGQFDVLGSIKFPFGSGDIEPDLRLRTRLNRIQTRVPAPIFRTVDLTASGGLELAGTGRPYRLTGQVSIDRLRAYRNLDCNGIIESLPKGTTERIRGDAQQWFQFDILFESQESVQLLTECVRSNISAKLRVLGSELAPRFAGMLSTDAGIVQVLKARFGIQRAEVVFDTPIAFDPRLDIQLAAPIENYQVYLNIDGYSSAPRTSFWSEPATTPWGAPVGQAEILRMIASGRAPKSDTGQGNVLASQVANYVYGSTALDESLSKALSRLTSGFVDTVQLQPAIENGQTAWKATLSRGLGERFNLGLNVEQSPIANNQSLTGTLYLNQTVNVLGGFDRKSNSSESYYELSGGLRFMFGGR